MCVIIAKKIKNINNELEWNLFKFRDRAYDPRYILKSFIYKNVEVLYLKDKKSKWIEGINSFGITLVSAALDNHSDASIGGGSNTSQLFRDYLKTANERNSIIIKRALRQTSIEDALEVLVDSKFIGNTFLTDGKKLFSIEISIPQKKLLNYRNSSEDLAKLKWSDFKAKIMNNLDESDFKVSVKEASTERLLVKTNHSIQMKNLGYRPEHKGYKSSVRRREIVKNFMKSIKTDSIENIMYLLTNLDNPKHSKNPELRPLRTKEKTSLSKKEKQRQNITDYYTTDIFGFSPSKRTMYLLPIHSKTEKGNFDNKETQCHFVTLSRSFLKENLCEILYTDIND